MKERPILFSGEMVRAILDGRKTQTRRVVKRIPCTCGNWEPEEMCRRTPEGWQATGHSGVWWCAVCASEQDAVRCPYGVPGDRLWVRETWGRNGCSCCPVHYKATEPNWEFESGDPYWRWRPSIHMPRWASRITLEITGVRVERLQEISEHDAWCEGVRESQRAISPVAAVPVFWDYFLGVPNYMRASDSFSSLWSKINGLGSWEKNPWVWVIEFKRVEEGR